ncbi:hypothetical protein [Streptomyces nitrosporeus]|uniref:hypothetical protein n=1 Tax=Streptomyces nitrosporeus TaxID=28894 RepID=UPI00167D1B79|nr:hypothetical protein [Streptomyces nitrosporeus]GGZ18639.1 hypothetical protein GCM10010327_57280 [Streptomyces nitrosporeus]
MAEAACGLADAESGRLDVDPGAPAYGTKVRWIAPKLIATVDEKAPGANMRVLAPASVKAGPATAAADPAPPPPAPAALSFVCRLPPRARGAPSSGAAGARCSGVRPTA